MPNVSPVRPGIISSLIVVVGLCSAFAGGLGYTMIRKDVTVVAPGRTVRHTTFKRTVGQALAEAGVHVDPGDEVSPDLGARVSEGLAIVVRQAVPVSVDVDGATIGLESAAPTVGALLERSGVPLTSWDKVFPPRDAAVVSGLHIRVVRIQNTIVTEQTAIAYELRSSVDPQMPRGVVRVLRPGRLGLRERVWRVRTADGVIVERNPLGWRTVRPPQDRVITVGSQVVVASRGQFAGKEMIELVATAYSPFCCPGVDDVTALGVRAGYGVVAVDPTVIPLGSRLYIEGYGYALAADTGSWIKGFRVDLGFDTKREAIRFGRRPVRVYIIYRGQRR